ncbi:MAG: alpha/beta fold hydrolase [Thermodesulfobacteriota bacterium]
MKRLKEKNIPVQDCQVYCLQNTQGSGKDVLLLHGAKFSASTWQELGTLDVLVDAGHRVHALDMPGYGKSPKCGSNPPALLQEIIAAEGMQSPVVIGPSLGGAYSLALYFSASRKTGGLVLVGTVGVDKLKNRIREIDVPCLVVWGDRDQVSTLDNAYFLDKEIKDSKLVILENAKHPCYLDQPKRWHEELLNFLS